MLGSLSILMDKAKRKWDLLSDERRRTLEREIISYFKTERDEDIGVIAAGEVLDFFLEALGPDCYAKAVSDAKSVVARSFENLETDLDLLTGK